MNYQAAVSSLINADEKRFAALQAAKALNLNEWCLAAGFVRNLVWDHLHQKAASTPLNDIDLIYFDPANASEHHDKELEQRLYSISPLPWSVKNQARMHLRNNDPAYTSLSDAMSFWPEIETAVGVTLQDNGKLDFIAPFGLHSLFSKTVTRNPKRENAEVFYDRVKRKRWLEFWPELRTRG